MKLNVIEEVSSQLNPFLGGIVLADFIARKIIEENIFLKIVPDRKSKLGDYKYSRRGCEISINAGLKPKDFLITTLHELAHHKAYIQFGFRIKPHGQEWKYSYQSLIAEVLEFSLPQNISEALQQEFQKPSVSHRIQPKKIVKKTNEFFLYELNDGDEFVLKGRRFFRKSLRRTRYLCQCALSKKEFTVHKNALVEKSND